MFVFCRHGNHESFTRFHCWLIIISAFAEEEETDEDKKAAIDTLLHMLEKKMSDVDQEQTDQTSVET